jgi:hypothetical protein
MATVDLHHVVTAGFEHGFQDILAKPVSHARADSVGAGTAWCIADWTA